MYEYIAILILSSILYLITIKYYALIIKYKILVLFLIICAFFGLLIPFHYSHILNNVIYYYQFRSIHYVEYLLIFIAFPMAFAGAIKVKKKWFFFRIMLLIITIPYLKIVVKPINPESLKNEIRNGVTLQTSNSSCGVASLATILRKIGLEKSEKELAKVCKTSLTGTEIWNIKRYLDSLSIESYYVIDKNIDPPVNAIAGIKIGKLGHFIPILSKDSMYYIIGDPTIGKEKIPIQEIKNRIKFTGFYLVIGNKIN